MERGQPQVLLQLTATQSKKNNAMATILLNVIFIKYYSCMKKCTEVFHFQLINSGGTLFSPTKIGVFNEAHRFQIFWFCKEVTHVFISKSRNELKHHGVTRESYELGTSEIETAISINLTSKIRWKRVETPWRYP